MDDIAAISAYKELSGKLNHPWHSGGRIGGDPIGSFETVRWVSVKRPMMPERIRKHITDHYGRSTLFIFPNTSIFRAMSDDVKELIQYIKDNVGVIFCIDCRGRYCPDELKKKVKSQELSFSIREITKGVILIET